jgi:hypothetical protein
MQAFIVPFLLHQAEKFPCDSAFPGPPSTGRMLCNYTEKSIETDKNLHYTQCKPDRCIDLRDQVVGEFITYPAQFSVQPATQKPARSYPLSQPTFAQKITSFAIVVPDFRSYK